MGTAAEQEKKNRLELKQEVGVGDLEVNLEIEEAPPNDCILILMVIEDNIDQLAPIYQDSTIAAIYRK